jgi:hypothetical protein
LTPCRQAPRIGAHYTSEADIRTLVEPVLMSPLRREWAALKGELAAAYAKGKGTPAQRERLVTFQKKLSSISVLDPACGSGNFLYVSLQLLLSLEKEVIAYATQLGFAFKPLVNVQQLRALEINPYAFELAQVSVQIGYSKSRIARRVDMQKPRRSPKSCPGAPTRPPAAWEAGD